MGPDACEYCGCNEVLSSSEAFVYFRCGTAYWPGTSQWTYANKCVEKRGQTLEERIQRALKRLETATRFHLVRDDHGAYLRGGIGGGWLDVIEVEQAIEILKGQGDEND